MDLSKLDLQTAADEGAVMELRHPSTHEILVDDGEPVTITLLGQDSRKWKQMVRQNLDKRLKKNRQVLKSAQIEEENIDILAACTLAWTGIEYDGEVLECNRANAKKVYSNVSWILEQAMDFTGERSNYLGEG